MRKTNKDPHKIPTEPKLSTQPYKGTKDLAPIDYAVHEFILTTWKNVCKSYGFKEYLTPLLENAQLYEAKSGDEVGNKELFTLRDLANRKLALRPEMTPSVTRLVTKTYKEQPKPIKLFSIANFFRNERPQKGRDREFWQLNADIFGSTNLETDIEILTLAVDLMKAFGAPHESFQLMYNSRVLLNDFINLLLVDLEKTKTEAPTKDHKTTQTQKMMRLMDKYEKYESKSEFTEMLIEQGFKNIVAQQITEFLDLDLTKLVSKFPALKDSQGYKDLLYIEKALNALGLGTYTQYKSSIVRGFDYYNGLVFEVFDTNVNNPRSLFGGGRYNGLASIFGQDSFPAVGFAPGTSTFKLFFKELGLTTNDKFKREYTLHALA